jgi:hypothetical protein
MSTAVVVNDNLPSRGRQHKEVQVQVFIIFVSKGIVIYNLRIQATRVDSQVSDLVLLARERLRHGLGSVADSVGCLLGHALALVAAGAGSVANLLAGALLALYDALTGANKTERKCQDAPGWTAPATRSPAPDRVSPAFWVVDFCESGVTVDGSVLDYM